MADVAFVAVTRRTTPTGAILTVSGELDASAAPRFRRAIATAIVGGGVVELDLAAVTFADSSTVRALLDAATIASVYGVGLRVVAAAPVVERLLRITVGSSGLEVDLRQVG